ncbi:toll/interleukin-1 receptor domain-containing protein [Lentzea sp. NEAU-D13]|uniref:Toll/interleukin-1 receptor domain-containing protein n=1 Tax=Lentzea alba TaxID=2714351 RepID=A0A7C9RUC2_9PSEU|nr:toll/interleukin-1 receptor domain-containing protein [Lentzea alba]NGY63069.1 toll/interleukin-1 receptor domain-containing protein [Lentzea alba]
MKASPRTAGQPDDVLSLPSPRAVVKTATPDLPKIDAVEWFDVFLAYNTHDLANVLEIADALRRHGIRPWIDVEQVRPGTWAQDAIQSAIRAVRTAAVFLGPRGAGRWQMLEIRAFVERCATEAIPVVPVLLPGVPEPPPELMVLRQLNYVRFRHSVRESGPLRRLCWGITGQRR